MRGRHSIAVSRPTAVNIESKDPTFDGKEEIKMEKKVYETPEVTKVEYDASDRITASYCDWPSPPDDSECNYAP